MSKPQFFQAAFWAALLFSFVSAILPGDIAPSLGIWDKAQHAIAFAVLTVLGGVAYGRGKLVPLAARLLAFGALIELVQAIPFIHRDAELFDWVADAVGITASLPVAWAVTRRPRA